ncbi:MAG: DCC1-like thiol-disulfide oxidoreductase family protein [Bacteroidota bacterium]|nr:DCC1-like thiol-disulfide oxidoreductase family protein [Bacteroidota bacterium]
MKSETDLILLYDGICGFCNSTVQLIIKHDRKGTIRFAAIQSQFAKSLFERHTYLKEIDSLILIKSFNSPTEKVFIRSSGALVIARYLSGWWTLFLIGYIIPSTVRDWFYDIFAKYRYRLFGKFDSCLIPPSEIRSRFIDIS